jgi:RTX calcium-binding nonapeptide repeat (4 copies)
MHARIRRRRVLIALAGAVVALVAAAPADAAPTWQCRASTVSTSLAGNDRTDPVVANSAADPCVSAETGVRDLGPDLGLPADLLSTATVSATTHLAQSSGRPSDQRAVAASSVENLTLKLPPGVGTITLGVKAARSQAGAACQDGAPALGGTSQVLEVTLNGQSVSVDDLLARLSAALQPLGLVVDLKVAEQLRDETSLTQRALHLRILSGLTGTPLVDAIVSESRVGFAGAICDASQQNGGNGDGNGGGNGGLRACPAGSELDVASSLCVIRSTVGGESRRITVGRPFDGPSGGTVVALGEARKRFKSRCLRGGGPAFAIVGTERADRVTGTNKRDRVLALAGNDRVDGGRGDDCVDGGAGRDVLSGALGKDRIFGMSGADGINGGPDADHLEGGAGNDTINAAFGRDRVIGGPGRDAINVSTAGPAAVVSCGAGVDKVRANRNERRRLRGCEVRYVMLDR